MSATQVLDPHTQWGHHHHNGGAPYYDGPADPYHHQAYHGEAQYHNEYDYEYSPHPSQQQQQQQAPPQQQPQEHQHQEPSPQDEYGQGEPQQGYYYDSYPQEDCYAQPPPPPPPHHAHHCPPHHAHHPSHHQQQQPQQQQQAPHHHTPPHHSLQPAHYAGPHTPPPQPLQQQQQQPHPRHHAHHEHSNGSNGGKGTPSRGGYNPAGNAPAGPGASSARKGGGKGGKGSCIAGLSMLQHSGPMIVPVGMEPPQAQQASSTGGDTGANAEHPHPPTHRRERSSPGRSPPHQPLARGERGDRGFSAQQGSYGRKGNKAAAQQQQQQQSQPADFVAQQRPPPTTVPHQAEAAAQQPSQQQQQQQPSQPHSNAKQQAVVPTVRELAESVGVEDPAATETEAWRTHVVEVACRLRGSDYYWYNDAVSQQTRVLVSADRGHDLGVVIGCWDAETAQRLNKIPPTNLIKRGHFFVMLRPVPTAVAKEKLQKQASQEQKAVEEANRIVSTLDLSSQIAIKDAVFQHDGRKLTLFYTTDSAYYKHYGYAARALSLSLPLSLSLF